MQRYKPSDMQVISLFLMFVLCLSGSAQETGLDSQLDRIAERLRTDPQKFDWQAQVESIQTKMNRKWEPKEVTRVEKVVRIVQGKREEEILKAVETKNGLARNVTDKYIKDLEKQRKKAEEEREKAKDEEGNGSGRMSFELDDVLPFAKDKRKNFEFLLRESSVINGQKAVMLEVRSKIREKNIWEGLFYFAPETYDLLRLELRMAKNPKFVKEFTVAMDFSLLEGDHLVITGTQMKIDGGFFLKKIRMLIQETYSDIRLL